ncbi:MAG: FecR family protein [Bacteroidota bacterium]
MKDRELLRYIENKTSNSEQKLIEDWIIASDQNSKRFNLLKAKYIASTFDDSSNNISVDKSYTKFLSNINSNRRNMYQRLIPVFKYAAVLVLIFGLGYLINNFFNKEPTLTIPKDAITLKLDNGDIKTITYSNQHKIEDIEDGVVLGIQKGNAIYYKNDITKKNLAYNTLTVPYGKRFELVLSDGTHIYLNAGSSLKYPVKFIKGVNRQVYLKGEAFFDVAKDPEYPFIVSTHALNTRVLGTRFNVKSYPEDKYIRTVLQEGSVCVYKNDEAYNPKTATFLKPSYKATLHKDCQNISVEKTDIELHTAWINGKIILKHVAFKNIVKKLERHYNVTIINNNKALNYEFFTATFDVETIEQVLETFNKSYPINYTIKGNKIIIN